MIFTRVSNRAPPILSRSQYSCTTDPIFYSRNAGFVILRGSLELEYLLQRFLPLLILLPLQVSHHLLCIPSRSVSGCGLPPHPTTQWKTTLRMGQKRPQRAENAQVAGAVSDFNTERFLAAGGSKTWNLDPPKLSETFGSCIGHELKRLKLPKLNSYLMDKQALPLHLKNRRNMKKLQLQNAAFVTHISKPPHGTAAKLSLNRS